MDEELSKAKRRVSKKFLGKARIHGVGIHPSSEETIVVYKEGGPNDKDAEEAVLREIVEEANPYRIEVVETEPPMITGETSAGPTVDAD